MQIKDVQRRVRNAVGDISVLQFTDETLNDWINDGIRECVWENSLMQKSATSNTVPNQTDYTLPADIFKLYTVLVDGDPLSIVTSNEYTMRGGRDNTKGRPTQCYLWAGKLFIKSTPTEVLPLQINYSSEPAYILYDSGSSAWLDTELPIPQTYHTRVVTYCLAQVAYQDDDYNKYAALMEEFKTGVASMKHQQDTDDAMYPSITVSDRDTGDYSGVIY